ncbi:DoxX-like family protein [Paenibacillus lutrae]|uniref:DoxX family protein n=1 Tax=Paenibacillus lutrae TaxID=2078573 RepID=A0A7X3FE30_9BACL|nr:DoxX-like family protein [Paenibacillus lutrae]MVO98033.1 hypothetical protein [Paenibacillus lutrae]
MKRRPIYVELTIGTDLETIWKHTQTPELHQQWDLRFSEITYLPRRSAEDPQEFLYRTRIGFGLDISGTGAARSLIRPASSERISTLKFGSGQHLSLIREGSGYWKYTETEGGVIFLTQYGYQTRFGAAGRWFDALLFRPLFGYATAWSFDLLRIWLEQRIPPAVTIQRAVLHYFSVLMLALLWGWQGLVPKLLYPQGGELALLQATGWLAGFERPALALLGAAQIAAGGLALWLHRRRWAYTAQIAALVLLAAAALIHSPALLQAPFGPAALSGSMIGFCLLAGWSVQGIPQAGRCKRRPHHSAKECDET